jgi:hypothetical protein
MFTWPQHRRTFLQLLLAASVVPVRALAGQDGGGRRPGGGDARTSGHHVYPKDQIQDALEAAARDPVTKTVYVHEGTYRPRSRGQALVWFNARHDGITLEAVGEVVLTAANPELSDPRTPGHPAMVNHVVYFGDGAPRLQDHGRQQRHDRHG